MTKDGSTNNFAGELRKYQRHLILILAKQHLFEKERGLKITFLIVFMEIVGFPAQSNVK